MTRIWRLILSLGARPGETDDEVRRRRLLVSASFTMPVLGLTWGLILLTFDEPVAGLAAFAFGWLATLNLLTFTFHRRIGIFRLTYGALVLVLPFIGQMLLGGFAASGAVAATSVVGPLSMVAFAGVRPAIMWFGLLGVELILAALFDQSIARTNHLPQALVTAFFVANTTVIAAISLGIIATFVSQKDSAMRLLAKEQERSESLLLNILPKDIVPRLKAGERPIADGYDQATILFADIVGFTPLSTQLPPDEIVALLDGIFSRFDELVESHGVEKIRTMGDAYMAVAGVPVRRTDHAQAMARLALDMRHHLDELRARGEDRIDCRIGINSGPLVGGVIGLRKFVFDIWGDPVNIASRMETTGIAGRIQIAPTTFDLLKDDFVCESRGTVEVKGKGNMPTWFLLGPRL